jgi:hypothetical protein
MSDSINNISHPRLQIPSLFDEARPRNTVPKKVESASDQFRFTTESSLEGFYKNPRKNVNQQDAKVSKSETKTEIWFG